MFVAASIGVHIARLYTTHFPPSTPESYKISALLILDSNISNSELTLLWPDPYHPSFDPRDVVAEDCTLEQYVEARAKLNERFASDAKNSEGLDRRNAKVLLPEAGAPKLVGRDGEGVWVTVVAHEGGVFAEEGWERMGTPRSATGRFTEP